MKNRSHLFYTLDDEMCQLINAILTLLLFFYNDPRTFFSLVSHQLAFLHSSWNMFRWDDVCTDSARMIRTHSTLNFDNTLRMTDAGV